MPYSSTSPTFYAPDRPTWRAWLKDHHLSDTEIWLVYPRKHTGEPRVAYNDAVEEALCVGWIDSITGTIDEARYAQRFSPRKARSSYSQTNIERLRRLSEQDLLLPEIKTAVAALLDLPFEPPADILTALQADPIAWGHFQFFSPAYQRIRLAYVDNGRKRPDEFQKRLDNLIKKTAQGNQFGFGIKDYY